MVTAALDRKLAGYADSLESRLDSSLPDSSNLFIRPFMTRTWRSLLSIGRNNDVPVGSSSRSVCESRVGARIRSGSVGDGQDLDLSRDSTDDEGKSADDRRGSGEDERVSRPVVDPVCQSESFAGHQRLRRFLSVLPKRSAIRPDTAGDIHAKPIHQCRCTPIILNSTTLRCRNGHDSPRRRVRIASSFHGLFSRASAGTLSSRCRRHG